MGFFSSLFGGTAVKFKKRYTENQRTPFGPATFHYEVYTAKTAQQAREFLGSKTVTADFTYIIVETPEGNWGMDKGGLYKENS